MTVQPPPTYAKIVESDDKAGIPWLLYFQQLHEGDGGTSWAPTFQSLGTTGTPTITGRYYRISDALKLFRITITPATDTTSTSATTYCDNFPLSVQTPGFCVAVGGSVGVGLGIVRSDGRIYTPAWSAVTVPVYIIGIVEAR